MENINDYMPLSNDWNKERLETLKKMFPDLFTNEGKLNINELKKIVDPESVSETERYEFRWFGKSAAKRKAFSPSNATLVFDEKRSVNPTETDNLIIEGENLEVLKLLSTAYREKVKCIYIDPPYNTGKDFVYSDNYSQDKKAYWEDAGVTEEGLKIDTNTETDGRYHSNWLNMMYSRLLIARQLLREDGVIFISIDDNEVHNLRKLCDEVFGEENFVSELCLVNNIAGRSDKKHIATGHEYVLMYQKTELLETKGLPLSDEQLEEYRFTDENGRYRLQGLRKRGSNSKRSDRPNMFYPVYFSPSKKIFSINKDDCSELSDIIEIYPKLSDGSDGCWRWGKNTFNDKKEVLEIKEVSTRKEYDIFEKVYLIRNGSETTTKIKSYLLSSSYTSDTATSEFKEIIKEKVFNNPKPVDLIKDFVRISCNSEDIVLDFFAGSGSTGQAVFELNKEDDGNRKFILVQIPEATDPKSEAYKAGYKKISDITIERNKRVIERIKSEQRLQGLKDEQDLFKNQGNQENPKNQGSDNLGFKVFKLVKSNFPRVEFAPDPEKTTEENIELLKKYIRDKEAQLITAFNRDELVTEILIKNGFTLNYTLTKQEEFKKNEIFFATDGEKESLICLDVAIDMETVDYFKKNTHQKFICLERALDTTKKWNLKHYLGDKFNAF